VTGAPGFFEARTLSDPYPSFRWLRANDPVHWSETLGAWLLTRYDDVVAAQRDAGRFSS